MIIKVRLLNDLEEQKGYYEFLNISELESKVIMSQIRDIQNI